MAISFKNVSHIYSNDTPFKYTALVDVNLDISLNKITAIVGSTGSGKSTLIQHLNALLLPTSGQVEVDDYIINSNKKPSNLKKLRSKVGLVFQFPEYQLFEETIIKDVEYGPRNFGFDNPYKCASDALKLVGLNEEFYEKSPLELSGGQKRRVAIAGILAMNPDIIVLDEPSAGLDPSSSKKMMTLFKDLNTKCNKTIVIVTHDMEQVLTYCDEVVVVKDKTIKFKSDVKTFFSDSKLCKEMGILPPNIVLLKEKLIEKGFDFNDELSIEEVVDSIVRKVNKK